MCEPISLGIAATAASVGGALYNRQQQNAAMSANRSAQDAEASRRTSAMTAERVRQSEFDRRGQAINAQQLSEAERESVEARQREAAALRGEGVDRANTQALTIPGQDGPMANPLLMPTAAASGATVQDAARGVSERLAATRKAGLAQAYLSGVDDQGRGRGRSAREADSDIATLAGARRGSLGAYGTDLNRETPSFRKGDSMLGDALIAGGQLAAGYAGRTAGRAQANAGQGIT